MTAVELWLAPRPKGRSPRWTFRVRSGDAIVFDSGRVAVRFPSPEAALWLAGRIEALVFAEMFAGCPGHAVVSARALPPLSWTGDLVDDCRASSGDWRCHVEHLSGPRRGGFWYASVQSTERELFHTAECGLEPRSGQAARWLCEIAISADTIDRTASRYAVDFMRQTTKTLDGKRVILAALLPARANVEREIAALSGDVSRAGGVVVGSIVQRRGVSRSPRPGGAAASRDAVLISPRTFLGTGKIDELKRACELHQADIVVFYNDLKENHRATLAEIVGVEILSRSNVAPPPEL